MVKNLTYGKTRTVAVYLVACAAALLLPANANGEASEDVIDAALAKADPDRSILWYDALLLGVEGKGWSDTKAPFDRLPGKAEGVVRPPVWNLSRHSAGLCVRFVTDSTAIDARWTLTSKRLAMPHMPATGVSGVDLYVKTDRGWRWLAVGRPTKQSNSVRLAGGIPTGKREFLLYLPLYNGVQSIEIGLPKGSVLSKAPARGPDHRKPILFWGTSITQGGCASRPGMVHTAILGRRLDHPIVNLGFSGNGKMEPEMARLVAEVDAAVYVIDCLPNMTASEVTKRVENVVTSIRKAGRDAPILLVEDRSYADAFLLDFKRKRNATSREALKNAFQRLQAKGVKRVYYLEGGDLIGNDGEATVDGSHPTDLGFMRMADVFESALRPLLP
ncbi:MAG: SGNH/GDSL hydrolase family protein [Planctomycetes bacterium]|nr:SGNH/GDSL hydrolase family protein [Planctomycetota bacterium]